MTIESLSLKANWLAVPFVVKLFRIGQAQGLLRPGLRLWELFGGPHACNKGEQKNSTESLEIWETNLNISIIFIIFYIYLYIVLVYSNQII